MSNVPQYPAGWYPDPQNAAIVRWWDGYRWTDAWHPAPGAAPAPPAPQASAPAPAQPVASQAPAQPPEAAVAETPPAAEARAPQVDIVEEPVTVIEEPVAAEPGVPVLVAPAPPLPPAFSAPPVPPAPAAPQGSTSVAPAYGDPAYGAPVQGDPAQNVRRDIPTNTVWIWLVVLLPLVSVATSFLFDWSALIEDVVSTSMQPGVSSQSWMLSWTTGSLLITLLGYVVIAAQVVFAYLDWRTLRARGVVQPFHWAWIFFAVVITNGVYVIGRGVVLRRRTGSGLAPVWAWIAVTVLGWIIGIIFVVVMLNGVFAALAREGLLTP
jgi:hypothetical protein